MTVRRAWRAVKRLPLYVRYGPRMVKTWLWQRQFKRQLRAEAQATGRSAAATVNRVWRESG